MPTEFRAAAFAPTALDTREAVRALIEFLSVAGLSTDLLDDVEIATTEAINNVVDHACCDKATGRIQVEASVSRWHLTIRIEDNGRAMPGLRPPVARPEDPANLPEGGFGWFLIRKLADTVAYHRRNGRNVLQLGFSIPQWPAKSRLPQNGPNPGKLRPES